MLHASAYGSYEALHAIGFLQGRLMIPSLMPEEMQAAKMPSHASESRHCA